ncbi:hypothetical protein Bbelb_337400 [Branchiostoma belcheri]|nr:hypothetical protein Bbelb_337400 [Branchiostoma belcheri]
MNTEVKVDVFTIMKYLSKLSCLQDQLLLLPYLVALRVGDSGEKCTETLPVPGVEGEVRWNSLTVFTISQHHPSALGQHNTSCGAAIFYSCHLRNARNYVGDVLNKRSIQDVMQGARQGLLKRFKLLGFNHGVPCTPGEVCAPQEKEEKEKKH